MSRDTLPPVGRRRKDGNPLGLERRVYWHHGQFIYRHRDGEVEKLGKDIGKANARAKLYNDPKGEYGTVGYFLDLYLADARAGRLLRPKKARTISDNESEADYLKAGLGKHFPSHLVESPNLIADYRSHRTARVRANRELSLLSAMFTWLIEKGHCPGLNMNPVLLIQRNPEKAKDRYVEDAEFRAVYSIAQRAVCMAMDLVYMTLQRPSDVLSVGPAAIRDKTVGGVSRPVLTFQQGKTGRIVDIERTERLDSVLRSLTPDGETIGRQTIADNLYRAVPTLVHAPDATPYTLGGIASMLRRYCVKAKVRSFGLMDLRAKGATDMYLRGVSLERIQVLMRHRSVQTTEIYIKRLLQTVEVAAPNSEKAAG